MSAGRNFCGANNGMWVFFLDGANPAVNPDQGEGSAGLPASLVSRVRLNKCDGNDDDDDEFAKASREVKKQFLHICVHVCMFVISG